MDVRRRRGGRRGRRDLHGGNGQNDGRGRSTGRWHSAHHRRRGRGLCRRHIGRHHRMTATQTPLEATKAMYDHVSRGEWDRVAEFMTEDFVINEPSTLPYGGEWRGRD